MKRVININKIWENNIDNVIDNTENLDFSVMSREEFVSECIQYLAYYFDNDMLSREPDYRNIVLDIAKEYKMITEE